MMLPIAQRLIYRFFNQLLLLIIHVLLFNCCFYGGSCGLLYCSQVTAKAFESLVTKSDSWDISDTASDTENKGSIHVCERIS